MKEKIEETYTTDKTGQTKQDATDCLNALIRNDEDYLATKIGQQQTLALTLFAVAAALVQK